MPLGYPIGTERRASPSPSRNTHQAATPSWSPGALQPKGKTCHNAVPGQKDQQKSLLLPPAAARLTGRVPAWFLADQEPQQKVIAKGVQPLVQNITDWELCLDAKGLRSAGAGPLLSVTALRIPWPRRKYCVTEEGKKQNKTKHIFFVTKLIFFLLFPTTHNMTQDGSSIYKSVFHLKSHVLWRKQIQYQQLGTCPHLTPLFLKLMKSVRVISPQRGKE